MLYIYGFAIILAGTIFTDLQLLWLDYIDIDTILILQKIFGTYIVSISFLIYIKYKLKTSVLSYPFLIELKELI